MNNEFEKEINIGGTVDRALSGQYELKAGAIFSEAWRKTISHFFSFSPAIVALLALQVLIFYIALQLQLGNPTLLLEAIVNTELLNEQMISAVYVANFSYEVISAPIWAGVSLMAMSHAAGLQTKTRHITKGLQYTIPVIVATLFSLVMQGLLGMLLPPLSLYLSVAFSHSILLICEKQVSPMHSLLLSLRAINRKLLVVAVLYLAVMLMFALAIVFYGIGLIFVLPFFFHLKGILYREMFGIRLKVVASANSDDNNDNNSQVFNA